MPTKTKEKTEKVVPSNAPYISNTDFTKNRLVKRWEIARIRITGDRAASPKQLSKWLNVATTNAERTGYTNVSSMVEATENDEDIQDLVLFGDRTENDSEYRHRQAWIIEHWQSEYEDFLRQKAYYESEAGKALLAEVQARSKRPIQASEITDESFTLEE